MQTAFSMIQASFVCENAQLIAILQRALRDAAYRQQVLNGTASGPLSPQIQRVLAQMGSYLMDATPDHLAGSLRWWQ